MPIAVVSRIGTCFFSHAIVVPRGGTPRIAPHHKDAGGGGLGYSSGGLLLWRRWSEGLSMVVADHEMWHLVLLRVREVWLSVKTKL
jgi:hypothetical protein